MLPLKNLDDREFDQIMEEAIKLIPQLSEEWSDTNYHDPGVTFIELFAWLIEMQQYYLNRITEKNRLKFLKLLSAMPKKLSQAETSVYFNNYKDGYKIPKGTKLTAKNNIVFETAEEVTYCTSKIEKVMVSTELDFIDNSMLNGNDEVYYFAFGEEPKSGNKLYIGFDKALPAGEEIKLSFKFYDNYPVSRGKFDSFEEVKPLVKLSFKYYGFDKGKSLWSEVDLIKDETVQFLLDGSITFSIGNPMKPAKIDIASDKERYWICFTILEEGFQLSPRIDAIQLNSVRALQQDTKAIVTELSSDGQPYQSFIVNHYVDYYGYNLVQIKNEEGRWVEYSKAEEGAEYSSKDKVYWIAKDKKNKSVLIKFSDGKNGAIPKCGEKNIRVLSYMPEFEEMRFLGKSDGSMNQCFELQLENIIDKGFMLEIGEEDEVTGEYTWKRWTRVEDFEGSKPWDLHYVFDDAEKLIQFGDNERGAVPKASEVDNICIISCTLSNGEEGNIKEKGIDKVLLLEEENCIEVCNYSNGEGGSLAETIEEAENRVLLDLKRPYKAVTSEDYEAIALNTPGLYITKAKAIPLYEPFMYNYPTNKAPGQVTVVVVPYSEKDMAIPEKRFLENVKTHLDKHRLLCTELHVIPPEYMKAYIIATVVVKSHITTNLKMLLKSLQEFFNEKDGMGWHLGKTLSKGDIYEVISGIDGVEYISDLTLNVEGKGIKKLSNGDIEIPPYALLYEGKHEIDVVSIKDLL